MFKEVCLLPALGADEYRCLKAEESGESRRLAESSRRLNNHAPFCYNCPMSSSASKLAWGALSAGLATLCLYVVTVAPEFPPGHDSAELIAACASGGIAHPPGYPLYTMLGHILVRLFASDPVLTMNLFSAACGALAVALAALAFSLFCDSLAAGIGAALLFAVATTPWRLGVGAEVFALHLALVSALLALAAAWRKADKRRALFVALGAFVFGLACSHHQTVVLLLLPLALLAWSERSMAQTRGWGWSWWVVPLFLAGLLPYLYLPWKAAQQPVLNWGNPCDLQRFLWVVLRQGYGGTQLSTASGGGAEMYHLAHWLMSLAWWQFPLLGCALGLFGLGTGWKRWRSVWWLGLGIVAVFGPLWVFVASQPAGEGFADMLERFYATSYLGFALLIALGSAEIQRRSGKAGWTLAILALAVGLSLCLNWGRASARNTFVIADAVKAMESGLPTNSLVVTCNDLTSGAFMYATAVEGRPVQSVPLGVAHSDWFREQLAPEQSQALVQGGLEGMLVQARVARRDVFCEAVMPGMKGHFVPHGLLYRYYAPGEKLPDVDTACLESLMYLENFPRRPQAEDLSRQPFWVKFYDQRWREAYRVLIDGLPRNSKAQTIAVEKSGAGLKK